jgi:ubiquinone/menaquinone biosynthesis C-methylase UbiE
LDSLASLGVVRKTGERFFNTKAAGEFLAAGGANDWRLGIGHHNGLWRSWSKLTDVVREGQPGPRPARDEHEMESFIGLMHQHGSARAPRLVKAIPLRGVKRMLDLGGGSGAYSIAFAKKNSNLQITLLDRPSVIALAERYTTQAGVREKFTFVEGDLTQDDFGDGFDLILISSICHQFSPEDNRELLQKAYRALVPTGRIVIHDFVLDNQRTRPLQAALFAVNMLVNTEAGNSYTVAEYNGWLKGVGFRKVRFRRLPGGSDLLLGQR